MVLRIKFLVRNPVQDTRSPIGKFGFFGAGFEAANRVEILIYSEPTNGVDADQD